MFYIAEGSNAARATDLCVAFQRGLRARREHTGVHPGTWEILSSPPLENISTKQSKIAALAGIEPKQVLTTLSHHIDHDWLCEAHRRTRKDGAIGVDGVDAKMYAKQLDENLLDLLGRFKSGTYRAPAVKWVHIDKGDGRSTRPLGIPSFEDKILQRAVVMVLEPIYEQDFLSCSYGFRPKRSATMR